MFAALLALAREPGFAVSAVKKIEEEPVDEQWVDPQVSFGGPEAASAASPIRFYRKGAVA